MKKETLFRALHGSKALPVAFDLTEIPYYGKENSLTMYSRGRTAAKRCYLYLTLQVMCPSFNFILDTELVTDKNTLAKQMKGMLRRSKRSYSLVLDPIYLDRGFYQVDVLKTLKNDFDRRILMPVTRTDRIKKAICQWKEENGYTAGTKEMLLGKGKNAQIYTLIFSPLSAKERQHWRSKKKADPTHIWNDFLYFCILAPPKDLGDGEDGLTISEYFQILSQEYRRRWGIETGYRVTKAFLGYTTSTHFPLRYWRMWNAITLYNLWVY